MKKSFFQRGRGIGRGVRLLSPGVIQGAVLIGVTIVVLFAVRIVFPNALSGMVAPLWQAGSNGAESAGTLTGFFTGTQALVRERDRLAQENASLKAEHHILVSKDQDLLRLLGGRTETPPAIVAGVLARPPVSPYDVLVVDRGTKDDVSVGAHVFGNGGTPLGTVASASDHASRILLYSAPGISTSAWVGATRVPITLVGQGSGAFYALVPRDAQVTEGDEISVAGPGALPVGTVFEVERDPSATKIRVRIKPIAQPFSTTWVTIARGLSI